MSDNPNQQKELRVVVWVPVGVGVLVLFVALVLVGAKLMDLSSPKYANTFFGLTALFSALAFAAFLLAAYYQKQQLTQQNVTLYQQRFENSFFHMLSLWRGLAEGPYGTPGISHFQMRCNEFKKRYDEFKRKCPEGQDAATAEEKDALAAVYRESMASGEKTSIGPPSGYFGTLRRLLMFVSESEIEDKDFFAGLARAQLTGGELLLLFYHCLLPENVDFKVLVERFAFLQTIDKNALCDRKHAGYYSASVFGN